jgi:glycosyltransferase involved in cell wall biosynthesis
MMRSVKRVTEKPTFAILVNEELTDQQVESIMKHTKSKVLPYANENMAEVIAKYCENMTSRRKDGSVIVIKDYIRFPKKGTWYKNLTGWLSIKEVGAVSGRLVDRHDLIIDSGGIITEDRNYFPLFYKYPKYYQSYLGNAEWVRNLSIISPNYCALSLATLKEYLAKKTKNDNGSFDDYIFWLSGRQRIVLSPQSTASIYEDRGINKIRPFKPLLRQKVAAFQDKYGNVNMSKTDPMRLFADEPLVGIDTQPSAEPVDSYQHDATILANTFDMDQKALETNRKIVENQAALKNVESVAWFLPSFDAVYAGLMNIFHFANFLAINKNLQTTVYILKDRADASLEKKLVVAAFPELKAATFVGIRPDETAKIKNHDIGIATQWATAYPLAQAQVFKRKCYFIQDNEVNFYPKGSISSLVELSYDFGFTAIANTEGLLKLYKEEHGGRGVVLKSVVDLSAYYPREDKYYTPKKPYKVFFYARPNMPRNAFELGIAGLKKVKEELGSGVEVITAGAPWDPSAYGVGGLFTNLGKIDYEAVPKLYRTVDAGLMFMFSGHPGVTASELMASGCPVVVNEYDDITWHELYKDEETCLVTKATASEVARNIRRCLEDKGLRKKLIDGGLKKVGKFYIGYEKSREKAYKAIVENRF